MRRLVESSMELYKKLLNSDKFFIVDEIMIAYKDYYCTFQQYMMKKPVNYGIKWYATTCSVTCYGWNFEV